jgi:23S rRNA (guanosine2251-2'-O)-methyltransferase
MIVYGINPVAEALKADRVTALWMARGANPRLQQLADLARRKGVEVRPRDADALDRMSENGVHQGVVADIRDSGPLTVDDLVRDASGATAGAGAPLIVVLDGIEDPHNVGAILRTADAAGANGVIRQSRRAAPLSGATAKASAGAVAHVRIADVVNIARALEELKALNVWTIGLAGDAPQRYDQIDLTLPTALVVGAEGTGLRRLVREKCDWLASIPMLGHVDSLNVSVATGIVLYEALRQRGAAPRGSRS